MTDPLMIILLGIITVLVVILILILVRDRNQSKKLENNLLNLNREVEDVRTSIKEEINMFNENTSNRVRTMEEAVNVNLSASFQKVNERLIRVDESQKKINELSDEIISLQNVLTDKKTRGIYGEIQLYNLLENIYSDDQYIKQYRLTNGTIVDAVIKGPENLGLIAIDSKFPLENYNRIFDENLDSRQTQLAKNEFQRNLVKHLKDIETKYLHDENVADTGFMFIPAESIYAYIYGNMQSVVELSYKLKVYIVSPTTLMAYLTAYKAINLDQRRSEKLKEVQKEYLKLATEFERFQSRSETIFRDFEKTSKDINTLLISYDKIVKRFKAIEAVELDYEDNEI